MTTSPRQDQFAYSLCTLGSVALTGVDSVKVDTLRKKDLALLIYLCVEGHRAHSRVALSSLLWGDHAEPRARHSLTQAIGRLRRTLPPDCFFVRSDQIEWRGPLVCDACDLERAYLGTGDPAAHIRCDGDFLRDFRPGPGAEEFEAWAEQRRIRYRSMAIHVLESRGAEAEARGEWLEALEFARRAVEIESLYEEGHRRIMRSWSALRERGLALRHYNEFVLWLETEHGLQPDPATTGLASELSAELHHDANGNVPNSAKPVAFEGRTGARAPATPNRTHADRGVEADGVNGLRRFLKAVHQRTSRWVARANGTHLLALIGLAGHLLAIGRPGGI